YESSLKYYRDLKNVIDTAREEGREEGRVEGRQEGREEGEHIGYQKARAETALKMLNHGIPEAEVATLLELTLQEVQAIKNTYSRI
ncbi:MAG: hypothetical protein RQ715_08200, partial [Methylococcales bacterium]|nr:hypothetical protein [Methylococcales bacterium]